MPLLLSQRVGPLSSWPDGEIDLTVAWQAAAHSFIWEVGEREGRQLEEEKLPSVLILFVVLLLSCVSVLNDTKEAKVIMSHLLQQFSRAPPFPRSLFGG